MREVTFFESRHQPTLLDRFDRLEIQYRFEQVPERENDDGADAGHPHAHSADDKERQKPDQKPRKSSSRAGLKQQYERHCRDDDAPDYAPAHATALSEALGNHQKAQHSEESAQDV